MHSVLAESVEIQQKLMVLHYRLVVWKIENAGLCSFEKL